MTLFTHATEFYALRDILENDLEYNEETGEIIDNSEVINNLFQELELSLKDKFDNSQRYIIDCESQAETLKKEAKRLVEKAIAIQNRADRVKDLMKGALIATGETKLKTDLFSFSIRNSESIEVRDIEELPRQFVRLKREADKKLIKEALKKGEHIEGCSIVTKQSIGAR